MSGKEVLSKRLGALRREAGFESQESLAQALGVSWATVSRWERGKAAPKSLAELRRLADVLGVSPGDLIDERRAA